MAHALRVVVEVKLVRVRTLRELVQFALTLVADPCLHIPTRIKVYNAEGKDAQLIDGVEELVKGCSHIPVAIDAAGNIFLAAGRKGYIVKCIPKS